MDIKSCQKISVLILLGCTCLAGCSPSNETSEQSRPESPSSGSVADSNDDTAGGNSGVTVDVQVGNRDALDQLVSSHLGKVVLVDFWATWCGPCVQQFPHTVELGQHNPQELAVIAVSMDEPDDIDSVREFLTKRDARFDNLISSYGVGREGFEAFEITDGAIPHYKVFDRKGKVRHTCSDSRELDSVIDELLSE